MYGTAVITIDGWTRGCFAGVAHYKKCNDYEGIYELLAPLFGHESAEDAASWCELASVGETYDGVGFSIEIDEQ